MKGIRPHENRAVFDALADDWDTKHGPHGSHKRKFAARLDYLRKLCRQRQQTRVLDVGCSTGLYLFGLSDLICEGVGVDFSPRMIAQARAQAEFRDPYGKLRFFTADAEWLSFDLLGRFELVLLVGVLEHVAQPQRVLCAIRSGLASGGEIIVIMRRPRHPATILANVFGGATTMPWRRHLSGSELDRAAQDVGLEVSAAFPIGPIHGSGLSPSCKRKSQQNLRSLLPSAIYVAHLTDPAR